MKQPLESGGVLRSGKKLSCTQENSNANPSPKVKDLTLELNIRDYFIEENIFYINKITITAQKLGTH